VAADANVAVAAKVEAAAGDLLAGAIEKAAEDARVGSRTALPQEGNLA